MKPSRISASRMGAAALVLAAQLFGAFGSAAQEIAVDPALPSYRGLGGISGRLQVTGSETLQGVARSWGNEFRKFHPAVDFDMQSPGSAAAPAALSDRTAQLGLMSRKMIPAEVDLCVDKNGREPRMIAVGLDAVAVYVHKDNPIQSLTLQQLDAVFSITRKRGGRAVATWGDLDMAGNWLTRPVVIHGRNRASGTYQFVREKILDNGEFSVSMKQHATSADIVREIERDPGAIGYATFAARTAGVRSIPIEARAGPVSITQPNVSSFDYPLARYLYIGFDNDPAHPNQTVREFLTFVLSKPGQEIAVHNGVFPINPRKAREMLERVAE